jgi:hypothetical protein
MKAVGALKARGETKPFTPAEIEAALKPIKARYGFSVLEAKPVGEYWQIAATVGKDTLKKPLRIRRAPGPPAAPAVPGAAAPAPAMPEKTFTGGGERHRIFIVVRGTRAIPMIQSDAQRITDFLVAVAGSRANVARDEALNNAYIAAEKVDKLANELETLSLHGARLADKRAALGDAENELAHYLQAALDRVSIATLDKGYLLEGLVATYGEMPKQSGDRLTPDHQPQNSLMLFAKYVWHPASRRRLFAGTRLGRYVTADGWAINLHHERHVWGATYGIRPRSTDLDKLRDAARDNDDVDRARTAAIKALGESLKFDAAAIEKAVREKETHEVWIDVRQKLRGDRNRADREELRLRIQKRVLEGERRLRQQPLEEFLKP